MSARRRYAIDAGDGIEVHVCADEMTPELRDALIAVGRAAMGEPAPFDPMDPCMSCGGNGGYGPSPHHTPDCYFAGHEDVA